MQNEKLFILPIRKHCLPLCNRSFRRRKFYFSTVSLHNDLQMTCICYWILWQLHGKQCNGKHRNEKWNSRQFCSPQNNWYAPSVGELLVLHRTKNCIIILLIFYRYRDFRYPPGNEHQYEYSILYWHVIAAKLSFLIVMEVNIDPSECWLCVYLDKYDLFR